MSLNSVFRACKRDILDIYSYALDKIRPSVLVESSISIKNQVLTVKSPLKGEDIKLDLHGCSIHVIGGGKSVLGMAQGFARKVTESGCQLCFSHGCLSVPKGLEIYHHSDTDLRGCLDSINVQCMFGSENNLPDAGSVLASRTIMSNIKSACESDRISGSKPLFVVLLSGGGSACLTYPRIIDLEEKLELIKWLVQQGADIVELNKVRRYFSSIKGGKLAAHILKSHPEASIITLMLSDVQGDPIEFIASGPTHLPNQRELLLQRQSMVEVFKKYGYQDTRLLMADEQARDSARLEALENRVIFNSVVGNNRIAIDAAIYKARVLGYTTKCIEEGINGESKLAVDKICRSGEELFQQTKAPTFIIGGGEVVINKLEDEEWGIGGRAQEMALDYLLAKSTGDVKLSDEVDIFLAGTTDGQDGPTEVSACLASQYENLHSEVMILEKSELEEAKKKHDSYNFWKKNKPHWQISSGLTGTNVMDLYMYIKRGS